MNYNLTDSDYKDEFIRKMDEYRDMDFREKINLTRRNIAEAYRIANRIKSKHNERII